MSNDANDPSANTQAFQAWVDQQATEPAAPARNNIPLIAGGVIALVIVLAIAVVLLAS